MISSKFTAMPGGRFLHSLSRREKHPAEEKRVDRGRQEVGKLGLGLVFSDFKPAAFPLGEGKKNPYISSLNKKQCNAETAWKLSYSFTFKKKRFFLSYFYSQKGAGIHKMMGVRK